MEIPTLLFFLVPHCSIIPPIIVAFPLITTTTDRLHSILFGHHRSSSSTAQSTTPCCVKYVEFWRPRQMEMGGPAGYRPLAAPPPLPAPTNSSWASRSIIIGRVLARLTISGAFRRCASPVIINQQPSRSQDRSSQDCERSQRRNARARFSNCFELPKGDELLGQQFLLSHLGSPCQAGHSAQGQCPLFVLETIKF